MEQKLFGKIVIHMMDNYKENHLLYDCALTNCCGICDKFYPCLYQILEEIKNHAEKQQQNEKRHL